MAEADDSSRRVPMRLQRFLARSGVASRRGSEDLMTAGRVRVNGEIVTELGARVDPDADEVTLDGVRVVLGEEAVHLALNKPVGVVTTMSDPQGRPTVSELVPVAEHPGLFPVGRLDQDTTGILLFTTDGELAHRLLHPRWKVPKTYLATVEGHLSNGTLRTLGHGVLLDDGLTAPAEATVLAETDATSTVRLVIGEGRKRQVRRMFSALGHPVVALDRTAFGPVSGEALEPGAWRYLTELEIDALRSAVGIDSKEGS